MSPFILLALSIICETFGSSMLKLSQGFKKLLPSIGVFIGYGIAFYGLSLVLQSLALGVVYAIWAGAGTALTAFIGFIFWQESFDLKRSLGLLLIISGVIILRYAANTN